MSGVTFSLVATLPFRLDLTAWALRRRPINGLDLWDGETYRRVLPVGGRPVEVAVTQRGSRLHVVLTGKPGSADRGEVTRALERLLGLRIDLSGFHRFAGSDARLGALARRFRGLKPPRFASVFEALINGIAGQQLSLPVGITLLNRLTERFGLDGRAFPRPEDLAGIRPAALLPLGFSHAKALAITTVARAVAGGSLDLEQLAGLSDEGALARLLELRGVGRWTAEYVLLRGLGRTYLFPGDDVGARGNLARWLRLRKPLDYESVERVLRKWRPYAGLIYFHLLLDKLAEAGYLA